MRALVRDIKESPSFRAGRVSKRYYYGDNKREHYFAVDAVEKYYYPKSTTPP
jgi:hypothetical protein